MKDFNVFILGQRLITLFMFIMYLVGIVITKGFWSTFFAIVFFPYSYYIVIAHFLKLWGLL